MTPTVLTPKVPDDPAVRLLLLCMQPQVGVIPLQGDIEKTDELLLSDDPGPETKRKRKLKPKQDQMGSPSQPGLRGAF